MPRVIEAVYENGVFKPLEKVKLREGERVRIEVRNMKIEKRREFLKNIKLIKTREKITKAEIERMRKEFYEDILGHKLSFRSHH